MRMNVDKELASIFAEIKKLGAKMTVERTVPRVVESHADRHKGQILSTSDVLLRFLLDHMTTKVGRTFW